MQRAEGISINQLSYITRKSFVTETIMDLLQVNGNRSCMRSCNILNLTLPKTLVPAYHRPNWTRPVSSELPCTTYWHRSVIDTLRMSSSMKMGRSAWLTTYKWEIGHSYAITICTASYTGKYHLWALPWGQGPNIYLRIWIWPGLNFSNNLLFNTDLSTCLNYNKTSKLYLSDNIPLTHVLGHEAQLD